MTPELRVFHLNTLPRPITSFEWERYGPIARRCLIAGGTMEGVVRGLDDFGLRMTEGQKHELQPLVVGAGRESTAQSGHSPSHPSTTSVPHHA